MTSGPMIHLRYVITFLSVEQDFMTKILSQLVRLVRNLKWNWEKMVEDWAVIRPFRLTV